MEQFSYEYFSGANIKLKIKDQEIDAVGISYQVTYSKQPVYSYYSNKFDAVLEGKHIVQGRFVINFTSPRDLFDIVKPGSVEVDFSQVDFFDIEVGFSINCGPSANKILLKNCFIMGHGQSIQIDDNVILTEYNFIGREIEHLE